MCARAGPGQMPAIPQPIPNKRLPMTSFLSIGLGAGCLKLWPLNVFSFFLTLDRKSNTSKYTYFIDNTRISHHQWAIVGIREMKECNKDSLGDNIQFSSDYSIRIYTSGCYYLDSNNNWQSDGLKVRKRKTMIKTFII